MENKKYIKLKDGSVMCINDIVYISEPLSDGTRAVALKGWIHYEYIHNQEDYDAIMNVLI